MGLSLRWPLQREASDEQRSYKLGLQEKREIDVLLDEGFDPAEIADELKRDRSTIYRYKQEREKRVEQQRERERQKDPLGFEEREAERDALRDPVFKDRLRQAAQHRLLRRLELPDAGAPALPSGLAGSIAGVAREVMPHVGELVSLVKEVNTMAAYTPEQKDEVIRQQAERLQQLESQTSPAPAQIGTSAEPPAPAVEHTQSAPPALPQDPGLADYLWRWMQMEPAAAAAEAREAMPTMDKRARSLVEKNLKRPAEQLLGDKLLSLMLPGNLLAMLRTEHGLAWLRAFQQELIAPANAAATPAVTGA